MVSTKARDLDQGLVKARNQSVLSILSVCLLDADCCAFGSITAPLAFLANSSKKANVEKGMNAPSCMNEYESITLRIRLRPYLPCPA